MVFSVDMGNCCVYVMGMRIIGFRKFIVMVLEICLDVKMICLLGIFFNSLDIMMLEVFERCIGSGFLLICNY